MIGKALLVVACALAPPAIALGLWLTADTHPLLPGMRGCEHVRDIAARIGCFTDRFDDARKADGLPLALRHVDRLSHTSPKLASSCHLAWHRVGERDGVRAAGDKSLHVPRAPATHCADGYVHGFVIGFLHEAPEDTTPRQLAELCITSSDTQRETGNCVHALGHHVARATRDERSGVQTCVRIATHLPGLARECVYAMYMEYSIEDLRAGRAAGNPCRTAPAAARVGCYAFLPARITGLGGSVRQASRACETTQNELEQTACIQTLVRDSGAPACKHLSALTRRRCRLLALPST